MLEDGVVDGTGGSGAYRRTGGRGRGWRSLEGIAIM
jgi:hypothetical protein